MKINAKIIDETFLHSSSISYLGSEHINWLHEFDALEGDTVFFTDSMLNVASQVQCENKIAILLEPPEVHQEPYDHILTNHQVFKYIVTFSKDLHILFPTKCLWFPPSTTWIRQCEFQPQNKKHFMSIIASDKDQTSGQKLRGDVVNYIEKSWPGIHVFGRGRNNELINKENGLVPYMFSIVIENTQYDDYFTEKIIDCFATGTIPIYWGTKNIGNYFDDYGIINFDTIEDLTNIISTLYKSNFVETINKYHGAMYNNFLMATKNYKSTDDFLFKHYPFLFKEN